MFALQTWGSDDEAAQATEQQGLIYPMIPPLYSTPPPPLSLHSCLTFSLQAVADKLSATDWVILS